MRKTIKNKIIGIAIIMILLPIYYGFLFTIIIDTSNSIVNLMQKHNMTTISFNEKVYNATSGAWDNKPVQIDLTSIISLFIDIIAAFAPFLFIFYYLFD